jgi:2-haloacid dehalogenase
VLSRRSFLALLAAGAGCAATRPAAAPAPGGRRIRAVAFDGFPIFDPRPVFGRAAQVVGPDRAERFVEAWRTRLFEYQWLRALMGRYADFLSVNRDALRFAARAAKLELGAAQVEELTAGFSALTAWPDARPTLDALRTAGIATALLSNMTSAMLHGGIERSGLAGAFDHVLSTDAIRSYKPAPAAYRLGIEALGLPREQVAFAAFAGWDAAGARWFGYPTVWVNRLGLPAEDLGADDVVVCSDLAGLRAFVG